VTRHEFKQSDVERLLVACHRRCCVCHRYCGVKIEVDHIETATAEGSGDSGNAIALCFECHAEVHHYNPQHPKGRRFQPSELRSHRDQWLRLCRERPEMFVHAQPSPEAGALERLLSELEFNRKLAGDDTPGGPLLRPGGMFEMEQFRRAIADGTFVWLSQSLSGAVQEAYKAVAAVNATLEGFARRTQTESAAAGIMVNARAPIDHAIKQLRDAL
jgi:HNH endonuclease